MEERSSISLLPQPYALLPALVSGLLSFL